MHHCFPLFANTTPAPAPCLWSRLHAFEHTLAHAQVRAEKAPSLDLDELQAHSVKVIQHLHHDGAAPDTSAQVRGRGRASGGREDARVCLGGGCSPT